MLQLQFRTLKSIVLTIDAFIFAKPNHSLVILHLLTVETKYLHMYLWPK